LVTRRTRFCTLRYLQHVVCYRWFITCTRFYVPALRFSTVLRLLPHLFFVPFTVVVVTVALHVCYFATYPFCLFILRLFTGVLAAAVTLYLFCRCLRWFFTVTRCTPLLPGFVSLRILITHSRYVLCCVCIRVLRSAFRVRGLPCVPRSTAVLYVALRARLLRLPPRLPYTTTICGCRLRLLLPFVLPPAVTVTFRCCLDSADLLLFCLHLLRRYLFAVTLLPLRFAVVPLRCTPFCCRITVCYAYC